MSENRHTTIRPPHFIISTDDGAIHGEETEENRELVRRIQACVNACAEISTEELERGIIQDMQRVLAEVIPVLQGKVGANRAEQPGAITVQNRAAG